ncbi:hypothetical protein BJY52DRAFT_1194071 [Lactarius psammicola]|nr:hypothetical protein BJY52DRAFT_1194071 [Lactarius psammicola]
MPESREDSVYLAKLAEQAERYEGGLRYYIFVCSLISTEMVENMKRVASSDQELTDSDKPADKEEGAEAAADDSQMLGTRLPVMAFV